MSTGYVDGDGNYDDGDGATEGDVRRRDNSTTAVVDDGYVDGVGCVNYDGDGCVNYVG